MFESPTNAQQLIHNPVVTVRLVNGKTIIGLLVEDGKLPLQIRSFCNADFVLDRARQTNAEGLMALLGLIDTTLLSSDYVLSTVPGFAGIRDLAIVCAIDNSAKAYAPIPQIIQALNDDLDSLLTIFFFTGSIDTRNLVLKALSPEQRLATAKGLRLDRGRDCKSAFSDLISSDIHSFDAILEAFNDVINGITPEPFEGQLSEIFTVLWKCDHGKSLDLLQKILKSSDAPQTRILAFAELISSRYGEYVNETRRLANEIAEDPRAPREARIYLAKHYRQRERAEWAIAVLEALEPSVSQD